MIVFSKSGEKDKQKLFSLITLELLKNGENVLNLSFNALERYLYKSYGINSFEVNKKRDMKIKDQAFTKDEIKEMLKYERETRKNFDEKSWNKVALDYINFLESLRKYKNLKCAIMWNTSYLYDRILYLFCIKYNIRYYVMEQGYFRPFTLALDQKGVNADANIPKDMKFYNEIEIDNLKYKKYLDKPLFAKENKAEQFNKFIYNYLKLHKKLKINLRKDRVLDITENGIFQTLKERRNIKKLEKYKSLENKKIIIEKYIFIPFQIETDSQIILNSNKIKKMTQLYECVAKAIEELNRNQKEKIKAVFKIHPLDKNINIDEILKLEIKNKDTIFLMNGNTKELIKNSQAVITINSTVGIEALCEYKKVITLGDAFYNIEKISYHCDNLEKLSDLLKDVLKEKVNKSIIDKFLYYLRFEYFKEIYWRNPDNEAIKKIVKGILNGEKK